MPKLLSMLLAALCALQPIGGTPPRCAIAGWMTGRACCCVEAPRRSCCAASATRAPADRVSVTEREPRCGCQASAPAAPVAFVREIGTRERSVGAGSLLAWIDQGARSSAATPVLSTASPPEVLGPEPPGLDSLVPAAGPIGLARGSRGLLAVTCVARC
jgi:hypothetical protein